MQCALSALFIFFTYFIPFQKCQNVLRGPVLAEMFPAIGIDLFTRKYVRIQNHCKGGTSFVCLELDKLQGIFDCFVIGYISYINRMIPQVYTYFQCTTCTGLGFGHAQLRCNRNAKQVLSVLKPSGTNFEITY